MAKVIRLAKHYTSGMIFQRYRDILIEGEAFSPCEVTATLGDDTVSTTIEAGNFSLSLPPRKADRGLTLIISAGEQKIELTNIYIGEVWLASGQSNMQWHLNITDEYRQNPYVKENPDLRFYTVGRNLVPSPNDLNQGYEWAYTNDHGWVGCDEESALHFSGVAYHFAHTLYEQLQIPIGIINCNVGGSSIYSWLPLKTIEENPEISYMWDSYKSEIASVDPESARADYHKHLDWITKNYDISRNASGVAWELPSISYREPGPYRFRLPGILYTSMLKNIDTFPVKGVLWYQGETDGAEPGGVTYAAALEALVDNFKLRQNDPDIAFSYVQLPPFENPDFPRWATVCDQMRKFSLRHPDYAMITTGDVGIDRDIHPGQKRPVGERLAFAAMHKQYDLNHEYTGPIAYQAIRWGDEIRISFLHSQGLHQRPKNMGKFELVYEDGIIKEAKGEIRDGAVYVPIPEGLTPEYTRYEFVSCPQIGLYNFVGLPASLFELRVE
ncbi:MAG: sialate O-acetylesterase [Defluviitaleaceae bacterium]|nr:sialate O-acetylesterase [Defluviitaleaceae bacterium]